MYIVPLNHQQAGTDEELVLKSSSRTLSSLFS